MKQLFLATFALFLFALPSFAEQPPSKSTSADAKSQAIGMMRHCLDSGDGIGAEEASRKALAVDPNCAEAIAVRALHKMSIKDYKGTIEDCSKALALKPKGPYFNRLALNFRYHAYIQLKDYKRAFDGCVQCLALRSDVDVALDAAKLAHALGRPDDEKKYLAVANKLNKALAQEIKDTEILLKKADNPRQVDEALATISAKIKKDPDDMYARVIRIKCYKNKIFWCARSKNSGDRATTMNQLLNSELKDVNLLLDTDATSNKDLLPERLAIDKELGHTDLAKKDQIAIDRQAALDRQAKTAKSEARRMNDDKDGILNLLK